MLAVKCFSVGSSLLVLSLLIGCKDGGTGPAADYTLSLTLAAPTIDQGATGNTTVTLTRTNFTGAVTLSLGSAPAGVTGSFNPAAPTGTSSTLTVSVGAAVAPGVYNLTVDGTGTPGNHSTPLTLAVSAPPADYTLSLTPVALTIVQGGNGNSTVTITRTNFTGAVTLSLGGAPAGVTGSFNPAAPTGASSTLTVSVEAAVAPGVYNLTVDGAGTVGNRSTALTLTANSGTVMTADVGSFHSCALNPSGQAYCWGDNYYGKLGDGTSGSFSRPVPTPVAGGLTFAALSGGGDHSCGVTTSGVAYCWGWNGEGELGDGTIDTRLVPTRVAGDLTFAVVSAGGGHTCGVTTAGAAYCWGVNWAGQLGTGTAEVCPLELGTACSTVPVPVAGGLTFATVSAGDFHTCGVTTSGQAYCWGYNNVGELGDGTIGLSPFPTPVAGGLTFAAVSAGGEEYTCGVTTSGQAYCWGWNGNGQLGDSTTTARLVPTPVAGGLTFAAVSGGYAHTCGVATSGAAYCWGWGPNGQLGDGTANDRHVPTAVTGGRTFAALSGGTFHSCGVTTSGQAYCWGGNANGQLGDGTTNDRHVPTAVAFP
jgi:alpha-tubulin suppressor-like RCC1 family protein